MPVTEERKPRGPGNQTRGVLRYPPNVERISSSALDDVAACFGGTEPPDLDDVLEVAAELRLAAAVGPDADQLGLMVAVPRSRLRALAAKLDGGAA